MVNQGAAVGGGWKLPTMYIFIMVGLVVPNGRYRRVVTGKVSVLLLYFLKPLKLIDLSNSPPLSPLSTVLVSRVVELRIVPIVSLKQSLRLKLEELTPPAKTIFRRNLAHGTVRKNVLYSVTASYFQ